MRHNDYFVYRKDAFCVLGLLILKETLKLNSKGESKSVPLFPPFHHLGKVTRACALGLYRLCL